MIKVDRYTCGQHAFFSLHNSENENDLKNMLKSYKLSKLSGRIVFFNAYNDITGKIWPQLCIELTDTEEIYDYDYDDNLQYNGLEEHICYLPIPFSPVTGERIEFSYLNKHDCSCSPFDVAKYIDEVSLLTIRQEYENGKDTTFALYTDGDKYKNILETVNFPLYVGR